MERRTVKGHSEMYEVSSDGDVFNKKTGRKLVKGLGSNGYLKVTLAYGKKETLSVHRLVAEAFIDNPLNLPLVNHKDMNKTNNSADNLEWCSFKYNNTYGDCSYRNSKVNQYTTDGTLVRSWDSMKQIQEELGYRYQEISRACRGCRRTSHGYEWRYA